LKTEGKTIEQAEAIINQQFCGMRQVVIGVRALCISLAAIKELEDAKKIRPKSQKASPREPGWLSALELSNIYIGSDTTIMSLLQKTAESKRHELLSSGSTPEDADAAVERLIGIRTANMHETLCASPLLIKELEKSNQLRPKSLKAPAKEDDWVSVGALTSDYFGSYETLRNMANSYVAKKTDELRSAGMAEKDIPAHIDKNYCGLRTVIKKEGLCLSPVAVAELLKQKLLRLPAAEKADWLSSIDLEKTYRADNKKTKKLLVRYATEMAKKLTDSGIPPEEAESLVSGQYVGIRSSGKGEVLCASPAVIAELERVGKLTARENQQTQPTTQAEKVGKRNIKPESGHLKRTGRARGDASES
ncbi:MAG: hypothetical protein ACK52W_05405, partial [Alphaproteobacteria bacterium]